MAIFRVTYIFETCDQTGSIANTKTCITSTWSETWYRDFRNPDGSDINNLETALYIAQRGAFPPASGTPSVILPGTVAGGAVDPDDYLAKRLPLMPADYLCSWVRVSGTPLPPYRTLSKVAPVGRNGTDVGAGAQVTCTIPVLFTAVVGAAGSQHAHRRKFHLHAVPGLQINGNAFSPTEAYLPKLTAFLNLLTRRESVVPLVVATPWRIRYTSGAFTPLTGIAIVPPGFTFTIPNPGDTLTIGARVQIRGATRAAGYNRTWTVIARDVVGHTATLGIARRPLFLDTSGATGLRTFTPSYAQPTNAVISQVMGSRRVSNRPFRLLAGRSRGGR